MTGLRLRQNLKLQDTDLESLSHQGFGVAMQLLKHREDAMDVVQDSLRKLVGGEVNEYGKLLSESREQALDRMLAQADELGANAVLGLQFQTSVVMEGAAEMMAFGTAVVVEDA